MHFMAYRMDASDATIHIPVHTRVRVCRAVQIGLIAQSP